MASAPPLQRLPVLWCACLHRICLEEPSDPLSAFFATVTQQTAKTRPPEELQESDLTAFCDRHRVLLGELLETRSTQTNEVGRCALLLPVLHQISLQTGQPLRLLDVGTSAGLNLHLDRYSYRYLPGGEISGAPHSPLLNCAVRGECVIPERVPEITARRGIDLQPLDLNDPEDALWLRACVWADQVDRSQTLDSAINIANEHPVEVFTGDAVADVGRHLTEMSGDGHLIVITTWVLSYLAPEQIHQFFDILDRYGKEVDLTWLGAEQPDQIAPIDVEGSDDSRHLTHLITREWRSGTVQQKTWATAHPHGYWMHWNPWSSDL